MNYLVKIPRKLPDDYERLAILTYITTTIDKFAIEDDVLSDLAETFTDLGTKLSNAMGKEAASPVTPNIKAAHQMRLECIVHFQSGLQFSEGHPNPEFREASVSLRNIYNKHFSNLPDKKRVTYSHAIKNFLSDLSTPGAAEALAKLNMTETITLLKTAQKEFLSFISQRVQGEEQDNTPHLKDARDNVHEIYDVLERHIFYKWFRKLSQYEDLINELNGGISEILVTAKSRHTHELHEEELEKAKEELSLKDLHDELHGNPEGEE